MLHSAGSMDRQATVRTAILVVALLLAPTALYAAPAGRPLVLETVVFGDEAAARDHFGRVAGYLAEKTGRAFKLVVAPDYLSASEDLRRGAADLAYLSPLLVCKTRRWDPGIGYLATNLPREGSPHYRAVVFALRDGGPADLEAARGQAIALVSEESAAGYHFPLARLVDLGFRPASDFRKVYLLGTHEAVVGAVKSGTIPVGAVFDAALDPDGGEERFRVLERSDPIPGSSLLTSPYVPKALAARLRDALMAPEYLETMRAGIAPGRTDMFAHWDFGWEPVDAAILDGPCVVSARVRDVLGRARSDE